MSDNFVQEIAHEAFSRVLRERLLVFLKENRGPKDFSAEAFTFALVAEQLLSSGVEPKLLLDSVRALARDLKREEKELKRDKAP